MKSIKPLKNMFTYALIAGALAFLPAKSQNVEGKTQDTLKARIDFANLEGEVEKSFYTRQRATFQIAADYKGFTANASGINEITGLNTKTQFGRDVLDIGRQDIAVCGVARSTDRSITPLAGVRSRSIPELLGCYGWIDATVGKNLGEAALFIGKDYGDIHAGLFHSMLTPYDGHAINYTELQVKSDITKNIFAIARMEIPQFSIRQSQYLIGVGIHP